jgi:hypothetical protein
MVTAHAMKRDAARCLALASELGFPAFVKPANAGSSVGVSKVKSAAELEPALRAALAFDTKVLVEAAVNAREIECAVLGNDEPVASMPAEIVVHHKDGFYSYDAKYVDADGSDAKIPADIPPETALRVRDLAVETFRVLHVSQDVGSLYTSAIERRVACATKAIGLQGAVLNADHGAAFDLVEHLVAGGALAIEPRDEEAAGRAASEEAQAALVLHGIAHHAEDGVVRVRCALFAQHQVAEIHARTPRRDGGGAHVAKIALAGQRRTWAVPQARCDHEESGRDQAIAHGQKAARGFAQRGLDQDARAVLFQKLAAPAQHQARAAVLVKPQLAKQVRGHDQVETALHGGGRSPRVTSARRMPGPATLSTATISALSHRPRMALLAAPVPAPRSSTRRGAGNAVPAKIQSRAATVRGAISLSYSRESRVGQVRQPARARQ